MQVHPQGENSKIWGVSFIQIFYWAEEVGVVVNLGGSLFIQDDD